MSTLVRSMPLRSMLRAVSCVVLASRIAQSGTTSIPGINQTSAELITSWSQKVSL
jgi:hypothetical protein